MIQIDKQLILELFDKAVVNPRLRMNFDLRTSPDDGGQRMLNALMPGTIVPIHRHPMSKESVICLSGKLVEIIYEEDDIAKDFSMGTWMLRTCLRANDSRSRLAICSTQALATSAVLCLPVHGIRWKCWSQASSSRRRMASTEKTGARL